MKYSERKRSHMFSGGATRRARALPHQFESVSRADAARIRESAGPDAAVLMLMLMMLVMLVMVMCSRMTLTEVMFNRLLVHAP